MIAKPYLSVVVTARNDNHGGDLLYRMQAFVDLLLAQCNAYAIPAELVIVEWNPPGDRPRLAQALQWPTAAGMCTVRIIEVPPELHATLEHADRLPLFQMIAKNVGIRRARGDFIVATNVDVLFDDGFMALIAERRLSEHVVYRVDRYDVPGRIEADDTGDWIDWCRRSVLRIHMPHGSFDRRTGTYYSIGAQSAVARVLRASVGRRPELRRRLVAIRARLYDGVDTPGSHVGSASSRSAAIEALELGERSMRYVNALAWAIWGTLYWAWCGLREPRLAPGRIVRRVGRTARSARSPRRATPARPVHQPAPAVRRVPEPARVDGMQGAWKIRLAWLPLHTNAAGDFTLMSREAWNTVRGYAELQRFSMHIDGLVLYQAHYAGIRERRLPFPIYHLEHASGFRPDTDSVRELNKRLEEHSISQISFEELAGWIVAMRAAGGPLPFNDDSWGFADIELPETNPVAVGTSHVANAVSR